MAEITITLKDKSQKIACLGDFTKATTFLVVGPGCYGYGESLKVAKQNAIKAGGSRKGKFTAYLGDDALGVNNFGLVSSDVCLFALGEI